MSGLNPHMCSTESVDEGLSFSSGRLWSNTIVSVLAKQNPLDRMISKKVQSAILDQLWSKRDLWGCQQWLHVTKDHQICTWYLDRTLKAGLDSVDFVIPQHLVQRRSLEESQHHLWPGILWSQVFSHLTLYISKHLPSTSLSLKCTVNTSFSNICVEDYMKVYWPYMACWLHSSVVFPPRSVSPRCRLPLWFSQALKQINMNIWNHQLKNKSKIQVHPTVTIYWSAMTF